MSSTPLFPGREQAGLSDIRGKSVATDCVVVGYNDTQIDSLLQRTANFQALSGGYRHLLANSLQFGGKRMRYSDLLNVCIERATGRPSQFNVGRIPNLGACYLVSYLHRRGHRAELINYFNYEKQRLAELLLDGVRSVAITTTYYFESEPIREVVDFVRARSPATQIIVGGPHIFNVCTDMPEDLQLETFKEIGADIYVFDSQGESTLSKVCQALESGGSELGKIPNLTFSEDGWKTHTRTARQVESNDMSSNVVDWSLFPTDLIAPTVQTRTARSCAFKCAFCRYPVMAGSLDLVDLDVVERELDYFQSVGTRYVLFIDDTFNIPEPRFKELCRRIIKKKYSFQWFSYFRCANADDECFDLMAQAGCRGVFLGIESGDQSVLRAMNKGAKVERYLYGVRELNKRGILTYASFIIGHPGETELTARNTVCFIEEAQPSFYCLESFFFDPKTPIGARAAEFQLQGAGYRWKHAGMDWRRAADLVEAGYQQIHNSTVLPLYSFDMWTFAYLLGVGFQQSTLEEFLRLASQVMVRGMSEPGYRSAHWEQQLVDMFRSPSATLPIDRSSAA